MFSILHLIFCTNIINSHEKIKKNQIIFVTRNCCSFKSLNRKESIRWAIHHGSPLHLPNILGQHKRLYTQLGLITLNSNTNVGSEPLGLFSVKILYSTCNDLLHQKNSCISHLIGKELHL